MVAERVAVVTGGGRGIGRAISRRLAQAGFDIVIGYRTNRAAAEHTAAEIAAMGRRVLCVAVDTVDDASVRDFFDAAARFGVIVCCKYAQAALTRAGGGAIVNISSAAATIGSPAMYVHYAAAKAGVDALTVGLSKELAPSIRVNAVSPGTIWTQFHQDPDRPAHVASSVPLGRAGDADEIAGAVAWLLSAEASYVTGANIRVAGGL